MKFKKIFGFKNIVEKFIPENTEITFKRNVEKSMAEKWDEDKFVELVLSGNITFGDVIETYHNSGSGYDRHTRNSEFGFFKYYTDWSHGLMMSFSSFQINGKDIEKIYEIPKFPQEHPELPKEARNLDSRVVVALLTDSNIESTDEEKQYDQNVQIWRDERDQYQASFYQPDVYRLGNVIEDKVDKKKGERTSKELREALGIG